MLSTDSIAGILIGGGVILILLAVIFWNKKRKASKLEQESMQDNSKGSIEIEE